MVIAIFNNTVLEFSYTTGVASFVLMGPGPDFQTFIEGIGLNNAAYYLAINYTATGVEWEMGQGILQTSVNTGDGILSRDTIYNSSNNNNKVNFSLGKKFIYSAPPEIGVINALLGLNTQISLVPGTTPPGNLPPVNSNTNNTPVTTANPTLPDLLSGELYIGVTGGPPAASLLTEGQNIGIVSGAGSIQIGLTGIVPVVNGGTGSGTALNGNRVMLSQKSPQVISEGPVLNSGEVLTGATGASPTAARIVGQNGINVNYAAGVFTVSKDDVITSDPVFGASGTSHTAGDVPDPGNVAGITRFLREDATWAVPPGGGGGSANNIPPLYNSGITYTQGNLVQGSDANYYRCTATTTGNDPTLDTGGHWELYVVNNTATLNVGPAARFTTLSSAVAFQQNAICTHGSGITISIADGTYNINTQFTMNCCLNSNINNALNITSTSGIAANVILQFTGTNGFIIRGNCVLNQLTIKGSSTTTSFGVSSDATTPSTLELTNVIIDTFGICAEATGPTTNIITSSLTCKNCAGTAALVATQQGRIYNTTVPTYTTVTNQTSPAVNTLGTTGGFISQ